MRITDKHLQAKIDRLNRELGRPEQTYIEGKAQIGNFHLSHAYGGVALHEIMNDGGGVNDYTGAHVPKRELNTYLTGLLDGLFLSK